MAKRKFSEKQLAAQRRFAEMARARAGKVGRAIGRPAVGSRGNAGMMDFATNAAIASLWILGGKLASRFVPTLLPIKVDGPMGYALGAGAQLAVGAGGAYVIDSFLDRAAAQLFLAGSIMGVAESGIRRLEVPLISPLLGDEGDSLMGYTYELSESPFNPAMAMAAGMGPMGTYPRGLSMYPAQ